MADLVESDLEQAVTVSFDDVSDTGIVLSSLTKHELELCLFSWALTTDRPCRGKRILARSTVTTPQTMLVLFCQLERRTRDEATFLIIDYSQDRVARSCEKTGFKD